MSIIKSFVILVCLYCCSMSGYALFNPSKSVAQAFQTWCRTIGNGNADKVVKLYAAHAVLLPTLQEGILIKGDGYFEDYFKYFTGTPNIRCHPGDLMTLMIDPTHAMNIGHYSFTYKEYGKTVELSARFTFVYALLQGQWMIIHQHSSVVPTH